MLFSRDLDTRIGRRVIVEPQAVVASRAALSILDAAPVAMALVSAEGQIRWANAALARLTQRPADDLVRLRFVELAGLTRGIDGELDGGSDTDTDTEQRWCLPDGSIRWVSTDTTPAADSAFMVDDRSCSIAQVVDVTEIRRVRNELERSNRQLTEFAYVASHDLSEPLRVIAGHVALLARRYQGRLDDDAEMWIRFAVDGCTRLRQLIDDMLDYSRVGRPDEDLAMVDLNEVLDRSIRMTFGEHSTAVDLHRERLPVVAGSAPELERVLSNLLSNAARFVQPGTRARIEIAAQRRGDLWRICVTDNGIGISEQYRERVFGLFQRLHRQEDYPGTGIGLAICRKIIEAHGGLIWVDAGPESGSRFCFELPDRQARS
jgi:signal transduction histidine kinase